MWRGPRLFSNAGPLERSASWALREPSLFDPGGGPTVAHTLEVSKRPEDLRLVSAAAAGDLTAVEEALPEAQLEAHVRLPGIMAVFRLSLYCHDAILIYFMFFALAIASQDVHR